MYVVRISVDSRLCAKTISCRPRFRNSIATRRVSARYDRRMPSCALTTGGLTNRKYFSPRGAPFFSTSSNGSPTSRSASSRGLAIVADEHRWHAAEPGLYLQPPLEDPVLSGLMQALSALGFRHDATTSGPAGEPANP